MFIPDPDFYPSRISDTGSKKSNKREGWKKICCHNFLCSHKFHNIKNYFSFEVLKKKIWANFKRIIELFTQKFVNKLSKIWVWDPGVKKAPDPDPQHCFLPLFFCSTKCCYSWRDTSFCVSRIFYGFLKPGYEYGFLQNSPTRRDCE
jgi:hypothetical protein